MKLSAIIVAAILALAPVTSHAAGPLWLDRVQGTSTTTGTNDFRLATSPLVGLQPWSVVGNGNTAYYVATDPVGDWEIGLGTYSSTGPTLTRTSILSSSAGNSKVSFPAGVKTISLTPPAAWFTAVTAAAGTVTSVGLSAPTEFSVSGSPVTTSGTLALSWANPVSVPHGGTGLSSGTSGGVPYFSSTTTMGSSSLLAANELMLGGGAGLAPSVLGSLGTTTTVLHGNAGGAPTFGAIVSADMNITPTACTNQFITAIAAGGTGTCTTDTLASAQHANQGTTTTLLHGNAAGNPSWVSVSSSDLAPGAAPASINVYTPQQFNSTAGSGSDDSTAINAAIAAAAANPASGGLVYFPTPSSGYYNVCAASITRPTGSPNSIHLVGPTSGGLSTIRILPGCGSPPTDVVYIPSSSYGAVGTKSASRTTIENLRIDGWCLATHDVEFQYEAGASIRNSVLRNVAANGSNLLIDAGYEYFVDTATRLENVNDSGHTCYSAITDFPAYNLETYGGDSMFSGVGIGAQIANFAALSGEENKFFAAHGWGYTVPNGDGQVNSQPMFTYYTRGLQQISQASLDAFSVAGIRMQSTPLSTMVATATVNAGGTGGSQGIVMFQGSSGTGTKFQAMGYVNSSGALAGSIVIVQHGLYSVNPTLTGESVSNASCTACTGTLGTGATVNLAMGTYTFNDTEGDVVSLGWAGSAPNAANEAVTSIASDITRGTVSGIEGSGFNTCANFDSGSPTTQAVSIYANPGCASNYGTVVSRAAAPLSIDATAGQVSVTGVAGDVLAGSGPAFTPTPTLGVAGSTVGSIAFANATSGSAKIAPPTGALGTPTFSTPNTTSSDTLVSRASTDTFTNKTFDTAGTGNSLSINGVAAAANTGTGAVVRASSPALTTPDLGTPSALVGTNISGTGASFTAGATNALKSASTSVDVSAATAPSVNQVLTATDSTHATWQKTGLITIGTLTTTSGTNQVLTGISAGIYSTFILVCSGVSTDNTSGNYFLSLSTDNGTSYGSTHQISGSIAAATDVFYGAATIYFVSATAAKIINSQSGVNPDIASNARTDVETVKTGQINAIKVSTSVGNLDAGSCTLYGQY